MTHLLAFIFGFGLCAALSWKRMRESRRAFEAACGENEILRAREKRNQEMIVRMRDGVRDINSTLSGKATPPASAEASGRHVEVLSHSGPPPARPHFFQGESNGNSVS